MGRGVLAFLLAVGLSLPAAAQEDAEFVSQEVPGRMIAGRTYEVRIRFRNTGSTTWRREGPDRGTRLGSQHPTDNDRWGRHRADLGWEERIGPGRTKEFVFTVRAPESPGQYVFQWRMVQEQVRWFGEPTPATTILVVAGNPYDAAFLSVDVPTQMRPGERATARVLMRNEGTLPWTREEGFKLGSQGPRDNHTWGFNRVELAPGERIEPGRTKEFVFQVTAPSIPGRYVFQWRMVREWVTWFGDATTPITVHVLDRPARGAVFVRQQVPPRMTAGSSVTVRVTMRNTGRMPWTPEDGFRLGSRNPRDNHTWGFNRVHLMPGDRIGTDQEKEFVFRVRAPATPGRYDFQWQMVQDGVTWFGQRSPNIEVDVVAAAQPRLDAVFVSQAVPGTMVAGRSYRVSVRMRNSGSAAWTEDRNIRLGSRNPRDNHTWGFNRVLLAPGERVEPGAEKEFAFTVRAPSRPGTYAFQWRMLQEFVTWFGERSRNVDVVVRGGDADPGSKLSIHTSFLNGGAESWRFLREAQPPVVKLLDNFGVAHQIKQELPQIHIVGRVFLDRQPMDGSPEERARQWWDRVREKVLAAPDVDTWEGYNEVIGGGLEEDRMRWYARFEAERVRILAAHGRRACIGNFSTGTPRVEDDRMWKLFYPAIDEALRHNGVLGLHEYDAPWMDNLFDHGAGEGWLCGRYRKVYRRYLIPTGRTIPLIITECGIDGGTGTNTTGIRGGWRAFGDYWRSQGRPDTEREYLRQLQWYDSLLREDDYVLGATIFSLEIWNWESFDIHGRMNTLLIEYVKARRQAR